MIKGQQTIEIGEVRCSLGFENGFFRNEFDVILSCYRRWGFCNSGKPEINIAVKGSLILLPSEREEHFFYHSMEYDSVHSTMLFDTEKFTREIGFKIIRFDRFTPVRIIELIARGT
jgi:hypothetical protein